jgi:hypothetical protein
MPKRTSSRWLPANRQTESNALLLKPGSWPMVATRLIIRKPIGRNFNGPIGSVARYAIRQAGAGASALCERS